MSLILIPDLPYLLILSHLSYLFLFTFFFSTQVAKSEPTLNICVIKYKMQVSFDGFYNMLYSVL